MNERERKPLEAAGFRTGDAEDFLELTDEERRLVELRVAVSRAVRSRRKKQGLTQGQVAKRLKTSQPRVAMLEAGASSVFLDAMFEALFALGGGLEDLPPGKALAETVAEEATSRCTNSRKDRWPWSQANAGRQAVQVTKIRRLPSLGRSSEIGLRCCR